MGAGVEQRSTATPATPARTWARTRFGRLWVDALSHEQALDAVRALVEAGRGGMIFTPNVDHVILAEDSREFRVAYRRASLCFADGVPLLWASRIMRPTLPAKLSGSDMLPALAKLAAAHGWGVYLLGGLPGAAARSGERLRDEYGVRIVGVDDARLTPGRESESSRAAIARIRDARPQLVFVALGAPKQELWINEALEELRPAVAMGVGASFDFLAGYVRRAPPWMSRAGLEWTHRLAQDPRRLWKRYLVRGPRFLGVFLRTARIPRSRRVQAAPPP